MALFKISKGLSTNLMTNVPNAKEGFAYFTTDDGKFYIDIAGDGSNNTPAVIENNRIPLNAAKADIATMIQATSMGTNDNVVYPLLTFEIKDSTKKLIEAKYGAIGIKNGSLVVPNVAGKDEILISNTGAGRGIVIDNTSGTGHAIEIIAGKGIKVAKDPTENLELTTKQYVDNKLANKSNVGHTHDDRYYTESEINDKLNTINDKIGALLGANDALVFKGIIDGEHPLPTTDYEVGHTYRVNEAGTYAGQKCEQGDLIICIADALSTSTPHWTVAQTNIDGAVIGPNTSTANAVPTFTDATGKIIKNNSTVTIDDTGLFTAPYIATGTGETHYFQSKKFRGEGDANTYYHAVDFGYAGHNQVDFHEYGGIWNFYKNTGGTAAGGQLVASIQPDGFYGNLKGNADTATTATSAGKLASGTVGSATQPVYFKDGVPTVINTLDSVAFDGYVTKGKKSGTTVGSKATAEGYNTTASGSTSHAEGSETTASGILSHAEGDSTTASGDMSHAEGYFTTASSDSSHAEGYGTTASGISSHAEGDGTTASGYGSHAEGCLTTASSDGSHAEGLGTTASGQFSHVEGQNTTASATGSHAEGQGTKASSANQHAQGKFNIEDSSATYAHIVGNGTADDARSNAHTLDWSGNAWFAGDVYVGSTSGTNKDAGSKKLATEEYVDNAIPTNTSDLTNDSGFITSSDVPQEVFIATYDTTTWNEIFDAFINDKVCVCVRNSSREVAVLSYINQMPPQAIFTSTTSAYITEFRILGNTWSNQKITIGDVTSYVKKIGDTITGAINCNISSTTSAANNDGAMIYHNQIGENNGIYVGNGDSDGTTLGTTGTANLIFKSQQSIGFVDGCSSTNAGMTMTINTRTGVLRGSQLWGAVWNDYAEFRQGDTIEAGKCVIEVGDDTLKLSSERMQPGANITSDTFGFAIGKTDKCKTPIAVSGRVLAYGYENREEFRKNIGRPVCSGPHGTVSIMTDEEYKEKGYCAIGTISAVPDYEEWGTGKVKVNGRVWIKVF